MNPTTITLVAINAERACLYLEQVCSITGELHGRTMAMGVGDALRLYLAPAEPDPPSTD